MLLLRDFPGGCPEQDPGEQGHLKSTSTFPELGFWGRDVEAVPWGLQLQVSGTPPHLNRPPEPTIFLSNTFKALSCYFIDKIFSSYLRSSNA